MSESHEFTYSTVWNSGNGQEAIIVAQSITDLERAWNRMTNSRVPLKRDMVERVRIEKLR